jgi:hypothetical protein
MIISFVKRPRITPSTQGSGHRPSAKGRQEEAVDDRAAANQDVT